MKSSKKIIGLVLCLLGTSCAKEQGSKYGDLGIIFDTDDPVVEAGGTVDIAFTVTGSEGATLNIDAVSDDESVALKVKYDANYQGNIKVTAPAIVTEQKTVKVKLVASDSHDRRVEKAIDVVMKSSGKLAITPIGEVKSMAVNPGGSFSLQYKIENLSPAKLAGDVKMTLTSGWTGKAVVNNDVITVTYTAPQAPGNVLTLEIGITDSYNRSATYSASIEIIAFTPAQNASNCHIVKPGSTLTINAVKGNSPEKLTFDNAILLWQDTQSLVSNVAGNGKDNVVVVKLNSGKSGNAVVAARNGETIVWSWLVWVTDYDPMADPFVWTDSKTGKTYTWMDRNLGAMSAEKYSVDALGLLYQWGRKDPFINSNGVESNTPKPIYDINNVQVYDEVKERPVYGDHKTTNLTLAIQTPMTFYTAPSSAWPVVDWLTDDAALQNDDLWGGKSGIKTVYDPCPEGWAMPASGEPWGFRKEYEKEGKLTDSGKYNPNKPWYIEYEDKYCIGFRYKTESGKEYWFPFSGQKDCDKGTISRVGGGANYNTRDVQSNTVMIESFAWGNPASEFNLNRPYGSSVRCMKESK